MLIHLWPSRLKMSIRATIKKTGISTDNCDCNRTFMVFEFCYGVWQHRCDFNCSLFLFNGRAAEAWWSAPKFCNCEEAGHSAFKQSPNLLSRFARRGDPCQREQLEQLLFYVLFFLGLFPDLFVFAA